jgi:hypothetical protein
VTDEDKEYGTPPLGDIARRLEAVRREAFVQGYMAAKSPATAKATMILMPTAEQAYEDWRAIRDGAVR